ncbi:MAG: hypothetical protein GY737_20800 [Desulfobacteraceae bacterium]|nr:hypothetical protein [Desulfobacteraceae bacterium]
MVSEKELDKIYKSSPYSGHMAGIIDSVITNELLIQEAIAQGIHKEERFRESVENFYEQSLIKLLIDRKFDSLKPEITQDMIDRYMELSGKDVTYKKMVYQNLENAKLGKMERSETITKHFEDLSAELKYIFVVLEPGRTSAPMNMEKNYICCRLISSKPSSDEDCVTDVEEIRDFLVHQKKSALFAKWMDTLYENADIQILTDRRIDREAR